MDERLIRILAQPTIHGLAHGEPVVHLQTHISHVFLAGERAVKIKKPVDFGFLDFTTLKAREHYCREEVRLNRRLADTVYEGVAPITATMDGSYEFDGNGQVIEWAVMMRRLPDDAHLAGRIGGGADLSGLIPRVAQRLVRFFTEAETGPEIARYGRRDIVAMNWDENLLQCRDMIPRFLSGTDYSRMAAACARFLHEHGDWLDARADAGRVGDGHGDLRCEHIYLEGDRVEIIDCVEFSQRFRCCDAVNDLAFLGMDLDSLGAEAAARELLVEYALQRPDPGAYALWDFFRCYRACVRGKVGALTTLEAEVPEAQRREAEARAKGAFAQAARYARAFARPRCIVICGPMGCGKSTAAEAFDRYADMTAFSTDVIRKDLAGLPPTARGEGVFGEGLYSAEMNRKTYATLLRRAERRLREGHSVVLDGTFNRKSSRREARRMAEAAGADCVILRCELDRDENYKRLQARLADQERVSDAGPELLDEHLKHFEWPTPGEAPRVVPLDLHLPVDHLHHHALQAVFLPE